MKNLSLTLILSIFSLSACNNSRSSYLSASNTCYPENDIAAYSLSKDEEDIFELAENLPTEEKPYQVTNVNSTLVIKGDNEEQITFSFVYKGTSAVDGKPVVLPSCISGLNPNTKVQPLSVEIPFGSQKEDGTFTSIKVTINIGNNKEEDLNDFLEITADFTDGSGNETSTLNLNSTEADQISASVSSFSSYYEGIETTVYQRTKPKKDSEPQYFIHYKDSARSGSLVSVSTRLTLSFKDESK